MDKYDKYTSKLKFCNYYSNYKNISFKEQLDKIKEEYRELMEVKSIFDSEFTQELLDLIQASVTMYHLIHSNDYKEYDKHVNKIKKRIE